MDAGLLTGRIYLDHAATTPILPEARVAMLEGMELWANPSSPHAAGRRARAMLEDARSRIAQAFGWDGSVILTSGATEALALAIHGTCAPVLASVVEHDAVLRYVPAERRIPVGTDGIAILPHDIPAGALVAIQHVNSETGIIQPIAEFAERAHAAGAYLLCDCSQSAGKLDLPLSADMIVLSAHKLGGPVGIGALLVRDLGLLKARGGQEQGYRAGTENLPAALGLAAALGADRAWLEEVARLRAGLDAAIVGAGGEIVGAGSPRLSTISSYRMPGLDARTQLVRFDLAGIAVSAGSACSSGSLRLGAVPIAMGWGEVAASEVIRVSLGHGTTQGEIDAFLRAWQAMATGTQKI